ncbi:MAG: Hsp20/alpha crystallin family protein [Planctomycetaceae bacterium]|nr:Hsp20/alpha crystallin family protein [Planctomycetaceae bacterium]
MNHPIRRAESDTPRPESATPEAAAQTGQLVFNPPIDIFETEQGLVLLADLPGVTTETLELQVQDNKLTLIGRVSSPAPEGATLVHQEYAIGHFLRSFILSDEVDHERISAKLNHGVLEVVLPRASRPEPRRIQVTSD